MVRRSCLTGVILSYLPALAALGLAGAVAAWAGALSTALWLAATTMIGYAYLYAGSRHRRIQYQGGVRAGRENQPELTALVGEVMAKAGIRRLDGVWLVPGASAGALTGHRDWLGRRHMGLTIGLLTAAHLDTAELKAVLAHEAGHLTDTNRTRLRLCARRRHASTSLGRRGSRVLRWYWTWFLKVTRDAALGSERHADKVAVSLYGEQLAARAHHRVAEAYALHLITIGQIVQPLWDRQITPVTLFEAYEAVWTQSSDHVTSAIDVMLNAPESPADTHPGLAERCGGHRYPLAPGLRGDLPLARFADLDRRCSAALARQQFRLMKAMSWPDIQASLGREAPPDEVPPAAPATASPDPVS